MSAAPEPRPSLDPESEEYQRLWAQGLRPRIFWVPDTSDPELIAEAERQAHAAASSPDGDSDVDLVESTESSLSRSRRATAHSPEVVAEWRRAAEEIARSPREAEDIAWVESVSAFFEEEEWER